MPHLVSPEQIDMIFRRLALGDSKKNAAKIAGVSYRYVIGLTSPQNINGRTAASQRPQRAMQNPVKPEKLGDEAKRALDDFGYFQRRYFGRIAVYWQRKAAEEIAGYLQSPKEELALINCPPGVGKTTTFTHDIPAWLTCRDRSIRGALGHAVQNRAATYTARLRRTLERVTPPMPEEKEVEQGLAVYAEASLAQDFGRFKPVQQELWTASEFIVMQMGGFTISEKEATWVAISREMEFLGGRWDFFIWDDLVTEKRLRTLDMIEADRRWWDNYAETRLEPGGLGVLMGQRIGAEDLYAYNRDKPAYIDEEDEEKGDPPLAIVPNEVDPDELQPKKYHHIIFKAHYPELCQGSVGHKTTSVPYGEGGCTLYPARLSGNKFMQKQLDDSEGAEITYQQGDSDPKHVLVKPEWVSGTGGHPGCWDKDRDRLELPIGLDPPLVSVVSCDPSAAKYWAILWFVYQPSSEQRFLMDLERTRMEAPDLLDWDANNKVFSGLLEEWWQTSVQKGVPITHVIVEYNACQRYLLQYQHVHRWIALRQVEIIPHTTHLNKSDPEFGIQMLRSVWQYGRIRLPGKAGIGHGAPSPGRVASLKLVSEVTRYPKVSTMDCLMAQWFFEFQLPNIYRPESTEVAQAWVPSWMRGQPEAPKQQELVVVR